MAADFNVYMEHPSVAGMSDSAANDWRAQHRVQVSGGQPAPNPVGSFLEASFPEFITAELEAAGFDRPTPIQSQSWPIALSGRDVIGLAATGSGKTLCFALPMIVHINAQPHMQPGDGPIALVLSPTRELALQTKGECDRFGASSGVTNTAIYGGVPKGPQERDLRQGVEIVIATPGRLIDFMDTGVVSLGRCSFLVLDEADRMLDLGFEPQLRRISSQLQPSRQTLLFSATWPKEVAELARRLLRPGASTVQADGAKSLRVAESITQHFEVLQEHEKHARLLAVLRAVSPDGRHRVLVFCAAKRSCEVLKADLRRRGFGAELLHGDKSQQERDWALQQFRLGAAPVLIATDVASRGLDVQEVKAVINYDVPSMAEDYVHRIGRTGRAGARGEAYSFLTPANVPFARDLEEMLQRQGAHVPHSLAKLAAMPSTEPVHRRWR